jgi:hypothetical protein
VSIKTKGFDKLLKKLAGIDKKVARPALRKAVRAGTSVIGKAVKAEVPVDEGVLKRATATKVSGRGLSLTGRAGADVAKLEADERRPSNVDQLVEGGHITPDGVFVPPSGHMRRAAESALPRAEVVVEQRLAQEIERALR